MIRKVDMRKGRTRGVRGGRGFKDRFTVARVAARVLACVVAFAGGFSLRAAEPVILDEGVERWRLGRHLQILEDRAGRVTFGEIASGAFDGFFKDSRAESPGFGISNSAFWVRFKVRNPTARNRALYLEVEQPQFDDVRLYAPSERGAYSERATGDGFGLRTREVKHWNFVFRYNIAAGAEQTLYLRLRMNGPTSLPLSIWEPEAFNQAAALNMCFFGMFLGLMAAMLVHNAFLCFSFRDLAHVHYVLLTALLMLVFLTFSGLDARYVWTESPVFGEYFHHWVIIGANLVALLFTMRFLETAKHMPRAHLLLQALALLSVPMLALPFFAPYIVTIHANVTVFFVSPPLCLYVGAAAFLKGVRAARFYLLAETGMIVGALILALQAANVLPDNLFTRYAAQLGSAAQAVLFSFALADRVNMLKRERETALADKLVESENVASLSRAFERFVPKQFLEYLEKENIASIRLGDNTRRTMTILFCDIRSFTDISENMSPDDNFRFINDYLSRVGPLVRGHGGFIDKFIGDAIMALYPDRVDDAVDSALSIHQEVNRFNQARLERGEPAIRIGIGIHTGNLMLGTVGEENRMDGTVISDAVNLASRIEGLTKTLHAPIIISESAFGALRNTHRYERRALGRLKVRGKKEPVALIEILEPLSDPNAGLKARTKADFERGIEFVQAGDVPSAAQAFRSVLAVFPGDHAAELYLERCLKRRRSGAGDRDGSIDALDKA